MNKKKIAALALSGTLLMGAAGFGAYSWFTSRADADTNLKITTGQFSLVNETTEDTWNQVNHGDTQATMTKDPATHLWEINKVQPGDEFTKEVTIKADGNLKQQVYFTIDDSIKNEFSNNGLILSVKSGDTNLMNVPKTMNPNDKVTATITLKVDPKLTNGENNVNMNKVLLQTVNGKFINVKGVQMNPTASVKDKE